MSNLENIYNQNYGTSVVTNGSFIAVGNPPDKTYDQCEGISRVGQVYLIKKDNFNANYKTVKIFSKKLSTTSGTLPTYYTEQSSSAVFTASLVKDAGSANDRSFSCSYLIVEDGTNYVYQSNYGSAIDLSTYFLAIGDTGVTSSFYFGQTTSFACVDIYVVNPNYTLNPYNQIVGLSNNSTNYVENYNISSDPICSITGSSSEQFGHSVSITNNYLAVGSPGYNNGRGAVYIYKYTDENCAYKFDSIITCDLVTYPEQYGFGHSVCLDKHSEHKLLVGSNQLSHSNVYLYTSSSNGWTLAQSFSQNTSSIYYRLNGSILEFVPSGSQENDRFGYSVGIYNDLIAIGAPNDLVYWEYTGSNLLRQRGSVYVYKTNQCLSGSVDYLLLNKLYGDNLTFKDNLFGYSVSVYNNKLLIGSPKPYFPFSSVFISSSINYYDKTYDQNDFGESTYCGQSLLYYVSGSTLSQVTSQPISKRKEFGKPFTAFGSSVSVSDINLAIGAPIPLNDDFHLSGLLITESGSVSSNPKFSGYLYTSSYQSEDCQIASDLIYFRMEECLPCNLSGALSGACNELAIFVDEQGEYYNASKNIFGKTFIYNISDIEKDYTVGNIFYNNNRLIINNTGSILKNLTLDPIDTDQSYMYMQYQSQISLFEKQFICTIDPGEFNISTNPSAVSSSAFDYGVSNVSTFNFDNLDLILRYINYNISTTNSEKWWNNFVSGDVDESILNFYTASYTNYESNRLTSELKEKCSYLNFDINGDGIVNSQDATAIWKYFIQDLTINNYQEYLNPRSKRTNYNDMISFLDQKTGKFSKNYIKRDFFGYNYSSSLDPTGSYLAPYITTVGLYDGADIVAIAKLAQPIKNTGEIPINIVVKWDT